MQLRPNERPEKDKKITMNFDSPKEIVSVMYPVFVRLFTRS